MSIRFKSTKTVLLSTTMLLLPAMAQTASAAIDELIVSAERRDANIQSVPVAVTAFTTEDLDNRQVLTISDIGSTIPGMVSRNSSGQPTNVSVYLRGIGQNESTMPTAESAVGIYIDDVYQARTNGSNIELLDIERVEVLRGPQGTLYGRNTIAGAMKFVTRKPGNETRVSASLGYGSRDRIDAKVSASGPIVENKLALGVSAIYTDQEGYMDRYSGTTKVESDVGDRRSVGARAELSYIGSDFFEADFSVARTEDDTDSSLTVAIDAMGDPLSGDFYGTTTAAGTYVDVDQTTASAALTWHFDNFDLKSITGYRDVEQDGLIDLGDNRWLIDALVDGEQISQEVQLVGSTDKLDWIIGAFYMDEESSADVLNMITGPGPVGIINSSQLYKTTLKSYSVFGQATYNVSDQLGLTFGARWTRDEKEFNGGTCTPLSTGGFDLGWGCDLGFDLDESWEQFTPKVGIDYQLNDDTLLYFSAAQGFQAGGYQARAVEVSDVNIPFDEATVWTYEAGVKTDINDTIRLNAAYFYSEYEDMQQNTLGVGGGTVVFNAGDATVQGLEVELIASPSDNLNIFANLAITDSEWTKIAPGVTNITKADDIPGSPDAMGSVGFDYTVNMANDGAVVIGGDYRYQQSHWPGVKQLARGTKVDDLHHLNGFVKYEMPGGQWDIGLYARNLTDDEFIYTGFDFSSFDSYYAGEPRSVMLKANFKM